MKSIALLFALGLGNKVAEAGICHLALKIVKSLFWYPAHLAEVHSHHVQIIADRERTALLYPALRFDLQNSVPAQLFQRGAQRLPDDFERNPIYWQSQHIDFALPGTFENPERSTLLQVASVKGTRGENDSIFVRIAVESAEELGYALACLRQAYDQASALTHFPYVGILDLHAQDERFWFGFRLEDFGANHIFYQIFKQSFLKGVDPVYIDTARLLFDINGIWFAPSASAKRMWKKRFDYRRLQSRWYGYDTGAQITYFPKRNDDTGGDARQHFADYYRYSNEPSYISPIENFYPH